MGARNLSNMAESVNKRLANNLSKLNLKSIAQA